MDARRPLMAGNWKMFKTHTEAVATASELLHLVSGVTDRDIMLAPTYSALVPVGEALQNSNISLGAQNLFWESDGAFTGEIAPGMLKAAGCEYVIIGHSERRQYFGETDETVNKRIRAAIEADLRPVLCIGETETQRDADETFSVLDKQIQNGLQNFGLADLNHLVVAYEPVWAIGTGKTASTDQAQEAHQYVRSLLEKAFGQDLAHRTRILYGGSVKPDNVDELMQMPDLDGALVGGASLKADSFGRIVQFQT